jgi:antitoxin ParD1/3/4
MTMTVDLGGKLEEVVEDLVRNGRYQSKSEVLREGVRLVQEREAQLAALEAAIEKGVADLKAGNLFSEEEVFAELEARYPRAGFAEE